MNLISVFDLNADEKLQLVEDLWDDLAAVPANIPVHEWQLKELDRRKENLRHASVNGSSWEEVKQRIRH